MVLRCQNGRVILFLTTYVCKFTRYFEAKLKPTKKISPAFEITAVHVCVLLVSNTIVSRTYWHRKATTKHNLLYCPCAQGFYKDWKVYKVSSRLKLQTLVDHSSISFTGFMFTGTLCRRDLRKDSFVLRNELLLLFFSDFGITKLLLLFLWGRLPGKRRKLLHTLLEAWKAFSRISSCKNKHQ